MPSQRRARLATFAAGLLVSSVLAAACASPAPTPRPSVASTPAPTDAPTAAPTLDLTPVPGGASDEPVPVPGTTGTSETEWGTILDAVPEDFPVYPGAEPADLPEGPISGSLAAPDDVDTVATWYRERLEAEGYTIENLSSPLEDGTRVMDIVTDLPECRIQLTFRPAEGSTMVVILYGAGCRFTGG